MLHPSCPHSPAEFTRLALAVLLIGSGAGLLAAAGVGARKFDVAAGAAERTLKTFSAQSGVQLSYPTDLVQGVQTKAIRGDFLPVEALEKMLAGTPLIVIRDEKPGAFAIKRTPDPNAQRAARTTAGDRPVIPNQTILPRKLTKP